jgi:hypothetical protein
MSAEATLAHTGLAGKNGKRKVFCEVFADPIMKRAERVLGGMDDEAVLAWISSLNRDPVVATHKDY